MALILPTCSPEVFDSTPQTFKCLGRSTNALKQAVHIIRENYVNFLLSNSFIIIFTSIIRVLEAVLVF